MRRLIHAGAVVAALTQAPAIRAEPEFPVQPGEQLNYRVAWAIVPGAGEIRIAADREEDAAGPRLRVTTLTRTRGLARMLLPFDAEGTAVFGLADGRLRWWREESRQRGQHSAHQVAIEPERRRATYSGDKSPGQPRILALPPGDPTDLMMGLLRTRAWSLTPGQHREALVLFQDEPYELTIHCTGRETVSTPLGTFATRVLEPRMDRTAPKGMFRRGGTVRVWIADDRWRLPVRFEVEFKIGKGVATLESHRPPDPDAASPRP